ncbi:MAG: MiaB/RimO family radical SAM methylthiotransferase [Patescibacteria group bacterium]|nr:MiaB/RimO family radical SAM methylthiotransferase [Patescibacteria group bacterium]
MKTYKIYTLGCKVNQYDSGKLAAELERGGFVAAKRNVNLAIVNSCAVTKTAIIKSGRMVARAKKENPKAKIALAGCWPKIEKVNIKGVEVGKKILSFRPPSRNPDFEAANKTSGLSWLRQISRSDDEVKPAMTSGRSRYFIKIQDGCEQFCSYCIIPYTRGKLKSRGEKEIIAEIKQAVKNGYQEVVLSGIHLGLWGKDRLSLRGALATKQSPVNIRVREIASLLSVARNDSLAGLIKKIIKINGLGRVRLSSIEITEVTDELISLMAESNKICKHLHIPLQSGCDSVLKRMNRPYDTKYFKNKIEKIRRAMPDVAITTDVIVGFPGETEKDFRDTEKFIKQIKFSRLHVFPFSAHEKTPAAKMPNQIEEKTKKRRAKILRELGIKLEEDYKKKFKGRELEIVIEQIKQNKIIGKTEYYFDVEAKSKGMGEGFIGKIIKVKNN